ncbi:MAG: O-antigen ligase family protein [Alphaproteobacteria bacterium]|nr:O-antigen ligase family protein [Alphaproteobacteria bacterium]
MNRGRIGAASIALVAGCAAPLAVVAPNGLGPLLVVAGLGALFARQFPPHPWLLGFGAFLAYALLSLIWTIDAAEGLDGWVRITLGAAFGLALIGAATAMDERDRAHAEKALVAGMSIAFAILCLQLASERIWSRSESLASLWHGPDTNFWALFNRSAAAMAILLPLGVLAAFRRFGLVAAVIGAAIGIYLVMSFNSRAAELALLAGAGAALVCAVWGRGSRLVGLALAMVVLLAPFIASLPIFDELAGRQDLSSSGYHRSAIWSFAAERIFERPIFGWGMHASRAIPGAKTQFLPGAELMPLHPHNAPLQLWLELGVAGAFGAAALMVALARRIRGSAVARAALAGSLVAAFVVASVGYGIWQGWWMGALWIVAALGTALAPNRDGC